MTTADERLGELLGAAPPASIQALAEPARAELADVVAEARSRQSRSLAEAFDATLRHVPFPLRGIVKKVLR